MTAQKKKAIYSFKPMKGLTFWALLLMAIEIFGLMMWALGASLSMAEIGLDGPAQIVTLLGLFLFIIFACVSGVVSLCWVYGASRNAHALRPGGLASTPGWAVGWFFVPIMSLFKPFESLRDIWVASYGAKDGKYGKGSPLIVIWWVLFIVGNLILRFSGDDVGEDMIYAANLSNVMLVIGLLALAASTGLFFIMVRTIHKWQLSSDNRVADQF